MRCFNHEIFYDEKVHTDGCPYCKAEAQFSARANKLDDRIRRVALAARETTNSKSIFDDCNVLLGEGK